MNTEIWAHRGASRAQAENTMAAFTEARNQGADGLEIDVQRTADGVLVVFHDEDLSRMTGDNRQLKELRWEELQTLSVQGQHSIPPLSEVLSFCKSHALRLNIELKNSIHLYPGMEEEVVRAVKEAGLSSGQVIYSSFNHRSMQAMARLTSGFSCGLLYAGILHNPVDYAKTCQAGAIHPMINNLQIPGLVRECHAAGLRIHTWTADEDAHIVAALALGVDAIITNEPGKAVALRRAYEKDPRIAIPVLAQLGLEV